MFRTEAVRQSERGSGARKATLLLISLLIILSAISISGAQQVTSKGTAGIISSPDAREQGARSALPTAGQNSAITQTPQGTSGTAATTDTAEAHDLGDIDVADTGASDVTYFDPGTIPDSPDIPDADWVFEVPVSVSNISSEVQRLGCTCEVFKGILLSSTIHGENNWENKTSFGKNKIRIDLQDGAFQGTVYVGVEKKGNYWEATHYTCWLYLIGPGPDHRWLVPTTNGPVTPEYIQMHSGHPFRPETYGQELPAWAKLARSEDSEDPQSPSSSLDDMTDALDSMAGN
jgi:hypothetical protein